MNARIVAGLTFTLAIALGAPTLPEQAPIWQQWGNGPQHRFFTERKGPSTGNKIKSFDFLQPLRCTPAIDKNNKLYLTVNRNLTCFDLATWNIVWTVDADAPADQLMTAVAVSADSTTVYVQGDEERAGVTALKTSDGSTRFVVKAEDAVTAPITLLNTGEHPYGFLNCKDKHMYAFNQTNGHADDVHTNWEIEMSAPTVSSDDMLLVSVSDDGGVHVTYPNLEFDKLDEFMSHYALPSGVYATPAILSDDRTIVVPTLGGEVTALLAQVGSDNLSIDLGEVWTVNLVEVDNTPVPIYSSLAVSPNDDIVVLTSTGTLVCISSDGEITWSKSFDPHGVEVWGSPIIDGNGIIFAPVGRVLYAIALSTGHLRWSHTMPGELNSSPVLGADGTLYVVCEDGQLHAFAPGGEPYHTGTTVDSTPTTSDDIDKGNKGILGFGTAVFAIALLVLVVAVVLFFIVRHVRASRAYKMLNREVGELE